MFGGNRICHPVWIYEGEKYFKQYQTVLDLLDYSDLVNEEALILFLDFYKAFDTPLSTISCIRPLIILVLAQPLKI